MDLSFYPAWVLMRKTGEIVFVGLSFTGHSLYIYTLQQDGSLAKKISKSPCDNYHQKGIPITDPVQYFNLLIVQILWREYLAISCSKHKDIKLVDMETLDITTAFNDDQPLGKMCKGWHKLYVEGSLGLLELDCSSTKFTKIREIEIKMIRTETGAYRLKSKYPDIWSFIPPPYNMVMGIELYIPGFPLSGGATRSVSLDEPHQTVWHLSRKVINGKIILPCRVVYSSRHNALFVVDKDNMTVWVLNPGTGEVLQSINLPELDNVQNVFLQGSQLVIVSLSKINVKVDTKDKSLVKIKINYFSFV